MSMTASDFMRDWVTENVHFQGYPSESQIDPEAEALAIKCVADAEAEGLSRSDLERQFGSVPAYMHEQLQRLADEEVASKP